MTRRRLLGAGMLLAILALLAGWAVDVRRRAFAERDALRQAAHPPRLALAAGSRITGAGSLAVRVADLGSTAGIRLATGDVISDRVPGIAMIDIDARGPEAALRRFARSLEGERPLVRLIRWSIRPAGGSLLRLEARAVAPLREQSDANAGTRGLIPVRLSRRPPLAGSPDPLFAIDAADDVVPIAGRGGLPQLVGIVGRLSAPGAMVRLADGSVRTLAIGEAADGWTLAGAETDRARFRRGGQERVVVLPARAGEAQ